MFKRFVHYGYLYIITDTMQLKWQFFLVQVTRGTLDYNRSIAKMSGGIDLDSRIVTGLAKPVGQALRSRAGIRG